MTSQEIFVLNERIQKALNKLPVDELVSLTAGELHEIWKQTTYKKDEQGNIIGQVEKWKELNPNDSAEEKAYIEKINSNPKLFQLPFIRKNDNGSISIDIGKMKYSQLSPKWQKENKEAAEVAVELTLDNFTYLANPATREVLTHVIGSAIHLLWKSRPANAYAKETELGQRYSNISYEEKMKDVRHIFIAENAINYIAKKLGIDKELKALEAMKLSSNR